ncbi:MAG: hypothetical protein ACREWG_04715 [Gammaproteobacteria bacterium]
MANSRHHQGTLKRKLSACLLVYLMIGSGNGQAPLLLVTLAHAHQIYVHYSDEGIRLTLHHPGHPDEHEPTPLLPSPHQPDVLDRVLAAITGQDSQADHVIQIPPQEPQGLAAFKTIEIPKALALPVTTHPFPLELACVQTLARPPPGINPTLASRRTTVLLI